MAWTIEEFKLLLKKSYEFKYVDYFAEIRYFTHYYHLNYNRWLKINKNQTEGQCWYVCNDTANMISNTDLPKDITILYNNDLFTIVKKFTDEECDVMDILE